MLDNNIYNLMAQLTEENKSLWRIKNNYIDDASGCNECKDFWQKLANDKEEHIRDLVALIKGHFE
ncbi:MAG: hypothetical protein ACQEP5_00590 [Actinomycetota bacterium]